MQVKNNLFFIVNILLITCSASFLQAEIRGTHNDWEYIFSGVFKPESFYAKNPTWLNNLNPFDRIYYSRHVLDLTVDILYGAQTFGTKIAELLFQVRNKGVWGNPESIASTTEAEVKTLEAVSGIALGDAYAVGPESLGFYADSAIDQYAFGAKFAGEFITRVLSYDLYTAILQNNSSNLGDTAKKILGQQFGRLETPERGFGKVNFLFAGRLNWNVFDND